MPIFGIFIAKLLFILEGYYPTETKSKADKMCLYMFIIACASIFISFMKISTFGKLGENITMKVRN
jgi:ATP-binding cassette subfamily B (MDR/TAP) protein 1